MIPVNFFVQAKVTEDAENEWSKMGDIRSMVETHRVQQDEIHMFRQKLDYGHNYEQFAFDVLHSRSLLRTLLSRHMDR